MCRHSQRSTLPSSSFVLRVEGLPSRLHPVRSSLVSIEVEGGTSLWRLELVPGSEGLAALLHRRDLLPVELQASLTLVASSPLLLHQTVSSRVVVPRHTASLGTFLSKQELASCPPGLTLRVACTLSVARVHKTGGGPAAGTWALKHRKTSAPEGPQLTRTIENKRSFSDFEELVSLRSRGQEEEQERRLEFGAVEELHYLPRSPRTSLWQRVTRGVTGVLGGVEAGSNTHPYMLLHASI